MGDGSLRRGLSDPGGPKSLSLVDAFGHCRYPQPRNSTPESAQVPGNTTARKAADFRPLAVAPERNGFHRFSGGGKKGVHVWPDKAKESIVFLAYFSQYPCMFVRAQCSGSAACVVARLEGLPGGLLPPARLGSTRCNSPGPCTTAVPAGALRKKVAMCGETPVGICATILSELRVCPQITVSLIVKFSGNGVVVSKQGR
jgi:hypothetical protein